MILIYNKDIDDFVNVVIDYLNEDFMRIGDKDKIYIDNIISNIYCKILHRLNKI